MSVIKIAFLLVFSVLLTASGKESAQANCDHECTSWIVMPQHTGGKQVLLHKNRDSQARKIYLCKHSTPGKFTWLSVSSISKRFIMANMGINEKGVAVAMNSGDKTDAVSKKSDWDTQLMAREMLENSATAGAAVKILRQLVKEQKYSHGDKGSIWFIADRDTSYIVEHDALRFAAHAVTSGFAIRANVWHFPEMIFYSQNNPKQLLENARREFAVRQHLFECGACYKDVITVEKINAASRIDRFPEDPASYPLCGKLTNSASTIVIDREFPGTLSSVYGAFGPPRHTVYLPIPFLLDKVPPELANETFSNEAFARFDAKRELLPQDKLVQFERTMNRRHEAAVEKARAILKKGGPGAREEAGKILSETFRRNWEAARKLSKGK